MAIKDWNGFKKNNDTYIPNDATARAELQNKVDKVQGKGLSTNDYDNTAKGIVTTAQNNIKANTKLIKDTVGFSGKNLLENVLSSQTLSNVTATVNNDKTVNLNGTASENILTLFINTHVNLKAGRYYLSGNPAGITGNLYGLRIANADFSLNVFFEQGKVLEIEEDMTELRVDIRVPSGTVCNNTLFKPMICSADILDRTYEPYHKDVVDTLRDAEVIESNNLFSEKYLGYSIYGDYQGTYINTITNGVTFLAKVTKNTNYVVSKKSGVGNRFRIAAFKTYPTIPNNDIETNSAEIVNDNSLSTYSFNSGEYEYIAFTVNVTNAISDDSEAMIRVATEESTYHPYYIPLKDSMFPREEQRVLGAKNRFNTANYKGGKVPTITNGGKSINIASSDSAAWQGTYWHMSVEKNTNYRLVGNAVVTSGGGLLNVKTTDNVTELATTGTFTTNKNIELTFNSGNNTELRVSMFCSLGTASAGDVSYNDISCFLATDSDDTYVPYAMTNKELTDLNTVIDRTADIEPVLGTLAQYNNHAYQYGKLLNFCMRISGITCNAYDNIGKINNCIYLGTDTFIVGKKVGGGLLGFQIGVGGDNLYIKPTEALNNEEVIVYNTTIAIK